MKAFVTGENTLNEQVTVENGVTVCKMVSDFFIPKKPPREPLELISSADWAEVGTGNGYFGEDASVHNNYSGSYNDSFTFNEEQLGGSFSFKFYGDKQYNFRLSYTIYATMNGTEQSIYSDSSTYQNGSDIHGWKTITLDIPNNFTAIRIYTSFGRVNSTYCFGGLGRYQLVEQ